MLPGLGPQPFLPNQRHAVCAMKWFQFQCISHQGAKSVGLAWFAGCDQWTLNAFYAMCLAWVRKRVIIYFFETFAARLIQAARAKTCCSHVALHRHNSGTACVRKLFKSSKDLASLLVCNEIIFFLFALGFFVSAE